MFKPARLTRHATQIARMARDGLSNPEIGARLFISARTVQYQLKMVSIKLGLDRAPSSTACYPTDPPLLPT
jgi:DNA-binding CsgD family transcriptional regulator